MRLPFQKHFRSSRSGRSGGTELSPEDVVIDSYTRRHETTTGANAGDKMETPIRRYAPRLVFAVVLLMFVVYGGLSVWLQTYRHDALAEEARDNVSRHTIIRPLRGIIYDNDGTPLVRNVPSYDVVIDKRDLPRESEREQVLRRLVDLLDTDISELNESLRTAELSRVRVAENISQERHIRLREQLADMPGVRVTETQARQYTQGSAYSHLLGYVGRVSQREAQQLSGYGITDYIGKAGVERSYEDVLRGEPGERIVKRNAGGEVVERRITQEPSSGNNVTLWADSELQNTLSNAPTERIGELGATAGAAVAMDVDTGGIRALVSVPQYDNNVFSAGRDNRQITKLIEDNAQPLYNRVVAGQYPTGSTIKPLVASAALNEDIISPQKQIDVTTPYIEVQNQYNPDITYRFHDWKAHGLVDMRKAIAVSSNVYFYTIGGGYKNQEGLGNQQLREYLKRFGWGNETGVDLPNEEAGFLPTPEWKEEAFNEGWYVGNTYHFAIGQGYLRATPLQVTTATAAIANGGDVLVPHAVQSIMNTDGTVTRRLTRQTTAEDIMPDSDLQIVREGMRQAVEYGSSQLLADLPVKAAAKTGTSEIAEEGEYHHWVTVFAPYDDPEIALTVLVENVEGLQSATLPIAKRALQTYFSQPQ